MKNRILSLLLVLALVLSSVPAVVATEARTGFSDGKVTAHPTEGPVSLPVDTLDESEAASDPAQTVEPSDLESKYADYGVAPFYQSEAAAKYQATDKVTFIVEMETKPLLETYSADEISAQSASVMQYQDKQEVSLNALKTNLTKKLGASEDFKINFTYTVATTGVSVTTEYGNKAAIEAMPGVANVYVAPMFSLPNDQVSDISLQPMTGNSSTMIGADTLNASGYTGIGTRIAILDTGILLTHPNFAALPEDKLENPLTRDEIEGVWDNLNASGTTLLPNAYYNTKIPYIFNYVSMDYNMDHMFAGSDHGTHVAGIAAGNKIEGNDMIGMAPDAQLIVMQVFNQGGGADWSTIMAALEDCIWLDVDAANLSLGAAAGFSDHDAESAMNQVLMAFEETDIEVLIASGNDTNNAYQNLWGQNMSLAGNPDIGLAGTPSTYKSAFAVASIDNDAVSTLYFTVDGNDIPFDDTATSSETKFFNNFFGQTLEFVMVPGTGDTGDYENINVEGKVAVVSRGTISFPEKQANAQAAGAIACVVYNNVNESFLMQINDGEGNIPCVSVSKAAGEILKNSTTGTLTVCEEVATLKVGAAASSFSSWGVTPDLKLKPEIAGVGGQVYSATDPQISGSFYSTWDGTSMATPQVAGAAAVLKEYFRENYPQFTDGQLRRVMADMMMSTAQVIMNGEVEYSPRHQGSGLVDLVAATTSGAYLSSRDAYEGRPKGEMGDDPERTGQYSFNFEINNFSDKALTYTFDSSVLTETLVNGVFIGNSAAALEAKIQVYGISESSVMKYDFNDDGQITTADARALLRDIHGVESVSAKHTEFRDVNGDGTADKADVDVITAYCAELEVEVDLLAVVEVQDETALETVTVPAGETLALTARIALTEADKAVVEQFPNGIYVEGFLYVNSADEGGVDMNMPFVGFYGNWSDAPLFDEEDPSEASLYPIYVFTNANTLLGANPYFRNGKSGGEYNAVSHSLPLAAIEFGQLRNALKLDIVVTDQETDEEYFRLEASNLGKTHYSASYGMIVPSWVEAAYGEMWDGKDAEGNYVPDGTKVTYELIGYLDDGDDIADDVYSFEYTVDSQAPVIENETDLQSALRFDGDRTYLTLSMNDNHYIAALLFMSPEGIIMGKYEVDNVPGETFTEEYEITGFGSEFTIIVADFAINEREVDVMLNLGEQNLARPTPIQLDKGRLYGSETFDSAAVEGGWFSANKADFSDPRNETFDSANRYYSAEYVNGYLVAQNAGDGHLYLVTPSGTYWGIQKLVENRAAPGEYGCWVLYDMAMDYSGEKDRLYAVGWYYMGDGDNNGRDDGYNALFEIIFAENGFIEVKPVGRISGVADAADMLTLGITTDGKAYGIDTNAKFYSLNLEPVWDASVGQWGDNVIDATYIGTTDFATYPGAVGANVIQSMGYDHNDGVMYWYAHSQVPNGIRYDNINVTYKVDLETAECTEIGTYGPGGQTALFVPHDIQSDLFTMGVQATERSSIEPYMMSLVEGQTKRLSINWYPWNAMPVEVTWASLDETVATVDKYGFVTGLKEGQAIITATAKVWCDNEWGYNDEDVWDIIAEAGVRPKTMECVVEVLPTQDEIYGFVISDFKDFTTVNSWLTYSAKSPTVTTNLGGQKVTVQDQDGSPVETAAMWYGGAYYNGYVYTTIEERFTENNTVYSGTALYRSKVTQGKTPAETTFGEPERIGFAEGVLLTNLAFDYNTSRMYALENQAMGGLGIVDLDNGTFDYLGTFTGDLLGPTYTTAMAVTADGTIVVADQGTNLYSVDPDTMQTTRLYMSDTFAPYYAAMAYDYDTGAIYWNPCNGGKTSPLLMVRLGEYEWETQVIDIGDVSTKYGVEQTVIFTIPENEPEAKVVPVEDIEITNGDLTGLVGGTVQLNTVTTPLRPTSRTITWTSTNENVVTVDNYGVMTYKGLGTATVTASITNKDEATYGGPFTDSIEVNVKESAGRFEAFLTSDEGGSAYYDFWINFNDYAIDRAHTGQSMISILSLRVGTYYDGFYYGYNDRGEFVCINAVNPNDIKTLGTLNRDTSVVQITGMAVDYTTGTMYGLTLPANFDYNTYASVEQLGELVTIDLDTGAATKVTDLDFNTPVFALACDDEGQLYAAGGSHDLDTATTNIYKLNKTNGALELYTTIEGAGVYTGPHYYGTPQYNAQMTYDFGTDRLYLNATTDHQYRSTSNGFYMVQLGENPVASRLGKISLDPQAGSPIRYGDVYLGLMASIPEVEELPVAPVNGIILNKTHGRVALGQTTQLTAAVRPSNAADPSVTWESSDKNVATVDQNGLVTGISAGTATITVISNETGVTNECVITVVELTGPQSKAYTVSANEGGMMTFNPALPAQTAEFVSELAGGSNIHGIAYGKDCLYYVETVNLSSNLYRYDLLSKESTFLTELYAFAPIDDIAYDAENNLLYAVAGFYLFQYDMSSLDPSWTSYSNYIQDRETMTLAGVEVVDGAVYTVGTGLYNNATMMAKYSDKYLSDYILVNNGLALTTVPGKTDMAYDSSTELFYLTDAGNNIYTMDLNGENLTGVDILDDGIDINGLVIVPPAE